MALHPWTRLVHKMTMQSAEANYSVRTDSVSVYVWGGAGGSNMGIYQNPAFVYSLRAFSVGLFSDLQFPELIFSSVCGDVL